MHAPCLYSSSLIIPFFWSTTVCAVRQETSYKVCLCETPCSCLEGFCHGTDNINSLVSLRYEKINFFWILLKHVPLTLAQNTIETSVKWPFELQLRRQHSCWTLRKYHSKTSVHIGVNKVARERSQRPLSADTSSIMINKALLDILMTLFPVLFRFQLSSGVKSANNHIYLLIKSKWLGWTICACKMSRAS